MKVRLKSPAYGHCTMVPAVL
uniref:Uncharacterized protein n=1 Tax=Anguilla anguilla TaxID=7936 RepID=A0A0E9VL37_ANGAN